MDYKQKEKSLKKSNLLEQLRKCTAQKEAMDTFQKQGNLPTIMLLDNSIKVAKDIGEKVKSLKTSKMLLCQSEFSALKVLNEQKVDLLIMNIHLENFDGIKFAESIRVLFGNEMEIYFYSLEKLGEIKYYFSKISNSNFIYNILEFKTLEKIFIEKEIETLDFVS